MIVLKRQFGWEIFSRLDPGDLFNGEPSQGTIQQEKLLKKEPKAEQIVYTNVFVNVVFIDLSEVSIVIQLVSLSDVRMQVFQTGNVTHVVRAVSVSTAVRTEDLESSALGVITDDGTSVIHTHPCSRKR